MKRKRKGQVVFEFVIAALILFALIFYCINYVSRDFADRHARFQDDGLEAKVLRVADFLLSDERGIVSEWPVLDQTKMTIMDTTECDTFEHYEDLLERLDLKQKLPYEKFTHLNVVVTDVDGFVHMQCALRTPPERANSATVSRYAVAPGNKIAEVKITIWE